MEGDKEETEGTEEEMEVAWEEAWEEDRATMTPHRVQIMGEPSSYAVHWGILNINTFPPIAPVLLKLTIEMFCTL